MQAGMSPPTSVRALAAQDGAGVGRRGEWAAAEVWRPPYLNHHILIQFKPLSFKY